MSFYLSNLKTKEDLSDIICNRWGFEYTPNFPCPFSIQNNSVVVIEPIGKFYNFWIFYIILDINLRNPNQKIETFLSSKEREIFSQIPEDYRRESLCVFSTQDGEYWHFVISEKIGSRIKLKRFSVTPENRNRLRTASEQLDKLKIDPQKDTSTESMVRKKEQVFNVEEVTDRFFNEYKNVFDLIKKFLISQNRSVGDPQDKAHRYTHQLLNRLMFLYFVQKKGCFGGDKEFIYHFWNAYRDNFEGQNQFHLNYLNILFFEALNQKFHSRDYLKLGNNYPDFNSIFALSPYLNGGLFKENELDFLDYNIEDSYFNRIFEFLESYNFTIEENTPFDQEIAINPEMLGYIYEMVVNVSEETDEAHKLGIFYTPKTEVELMIRNSLVEYLFNKTKIDKIALYEFVFVEKGEQKIPQFSQNEREKLLKELDEIAILDPACGSGHYLVVVLDILFELKEAIYQQMEKEYDKFQEKKKIIEKSIFGVDLKSWAVEIAKLRLWLDLFLEATEEQLTNRLEPLLPSLSFKVRVGDSLVQSIGEIIPLRKFKPHKSIIPKVNQLAQHKILIYQNKYDDAKKIIEEEKNLFGQILQLRTIQLKQEIQNLNVKIEKLKKQIEEKDRTPLTGGFLRQETETKNPENLLRKDKSELEEKNTELSELEKFSEYFYTLISEHREPPLIWSIGFAEIFSEKDGFDIIIANPPYVRQELISDPTKLEHQSIEERRQYKEKLLKQIQLDWNDEKGDLIKLNKKCDLYIYFYLKGLKLLNPNGVMCFISSNSWLDVDYGKGLQEILLKRVPIIGIYDNQAKRSFKHADVNTIIIFLKAPLEKNWQNDLKDNLIKFVVFKKPFEEIMFSDTFIEIENTKEKVENEKFKIFPIKQIDLWIDGIQLQKKEGGLDFNNVKITNYIGNKWGGKYLRAPEIYWKILEKGKGKLVKLGDIFKNYYGIKTGANEFFYLKPLGRTVKEVVEIAQNNPEVLIRVQNGEGWEGEIEAEFLKPVIKSPRNLKTITIYLENLNYLVFTCHKNKRELVDKNALEYIMQGELQKYNERPSCKGRNEWWNIAESKGNILCFASVNNRFFFPSNPNNFIFEHTLYGFYCKNSVEEYTLIINSSLTTLFLLLYGRASLGEGALTMMVYEYLKIPILEAKFFKIDKRILPLLTRPINSIFVEVGIDPSKPIRSQQPNPLPDRKALDDIIFDILGLTEEERKEVYWAVCELVKNRLEKARSV